MRIIRSVSQMQAISKKFKRSGKSIGLVPTMGALHEGHLALIKRARKENDITVVSIFVNPKQFGPNEDYLRYPRPFGEDKKLCASAGVDAVFAPGVKDMYPGPQKTYISVEEMSGVLCGAFRPGHFRGVATVVAKLFNITLPDRSYFGMKDYQQLAILKAMARDLNFPVSIIPVPTVRERDGLAMSSRNRYLNPAERAQSIQLFKSLQRANDMLEYPKNKNLSKIKQTMRSEISRIPHSQIDYIEISDPETLEPLKKAEKGPLLVSLAVRIGKTRLIDNIVTKK